MARPWGGLVANRWSMCKRATPSWNKSGDAVKFDRLHPRADLASRSTGDCRHSICIDHIAWTLAKISPHSPFPCLVLHRSSKRTIFLLRGETATPPRRWPPWQCRLKCLCLFGLGPDLEPLLPSLSALPGLSTLLGHSTIAPCRAADLMCNHVNV